MTWAGRSWTKSTTGTSASPCGGRSNGAATCFWSRWSAKVEYVSAFPQDDFAIWLGTAIDIERDALGTDSPRLEEVRAVLRCGFTQDWLRGLMTTAQSQETVDRDYEGKWFYAVR